MFWCNRTTYRSSACKHYMEITQSHISVASPAGIFRGARISWEEIRAPLKMPAGEANISVALIRLSSTTHNLLTSNTSEISSDNSEKLSLLAVKHLSTFLLQSSYSSSRMYGHTVTHVQYSRPDSSGQNHESDGV